MIDKELRFSGVPALYEYQDAMPNCREILVAVANFHAAAAMVAKHISIIGRVVDTESKAYHEALHSLIDYDKLNSKGLMDAAAQRTFLMLFDFADTSVDIYKKGEEIYHVLTRLCAIGVAYYDNCKFYDPLLSLLIGLSMGVYWALFCDLSDRVGGYPKQSKKMKKKAKEGDPYYSGAGVGLWFCLTCKRCVRSRSASCSFVCVR